VERNLGETTAHFVVQILGDALTNRGGGMPPFQARPTDSPAQYGDGKKRQTAEPGAPVKRRPDGKNKANRRPGRSAFPHRPDL
jgi:hypothetical protein